MEGNRKGAAFLLSCFDEFLKKTKQNKCSGKASEQVHGVMRKVHYNPKKSAKKSPKKTPKKNKDKNDEMTDHKVAKRS